MHKINLCYFLAYKTSVFVRQNSTISSFSSHDSWAILSPIEQQIKDKIERIGTPLRDWDIRINYGIKTGLNEAFIITAEQRIVLLEQDPRSAEILRPILRGRDIKRYMYEYQDLWLIATFPSLKINIDLYPAVKQYLVKIGLNRLQQNGEPGARKRTNNKWFETQDSISYWEDFSKQKIVWYFMKIAATSGVGTRRWIKVYIEQICIPKVPSLAIEKKIDALVCAIQYSKMLGEDTRELERRIEIEFFNLLEFSDEEIDHIYTSLPLFDNIKSTSSGVS